MEWFKLPIARQRIILEQTAQRSGIPAIAIEKDIWVSLLLKAIFSLKYRESMLFKGGTSLSKGWGLIARFSEDIDIVIDRKYSELFKKDYEEMRTYKIYDPDVLTWDKLIEALTELQYKPK